MNDYTYESWLAGHANRKSMMEKLERSLIPYELFAMMPLKDDFENIEGYLLHNQNRYRYTVKFDYEHFGSRIYDAHIECVDLKSPWDNPLMGYTRFKIVKDGGTITTIYSDQNFFQQVIDAFEREDLDFLSAHRTDYVKNLLARYIMLRLLIDRNQSRQLMSCVATQQGHKLTAISASANKSEVIFYAFDKDEAITTARRFDGLAKCLTVVFFLNRSFNRHGNTQRYESSTSRVMSIHQFLRTLTLDTAERLYAERKILFLASYLYRESLNWNTLRVEQVVKAPPYFGASLRAYKQGRKKYHAQFHGKEPWWSRPSSALLEDALNVIDIAPVGMSDIFHFLCATTLVNSYINRMNFCRSYHDEYIRRMFTAKQQMFVGLKAIARQHNTDIEVAMDQAGAVMVNIRMNGILFQFSYRGASAEVLREFRDMHIPQRGRYNGCSMQAIATALYQYSHILRWKALKQNE